MALPTPPPEISRDDEAGAVAAAKYFFLDLYPYVKFTQDTRAWESMSHPNCVFCKSVLDTVASQRSAGIRTAVAPIVVHSLSAQEVNPLMFSVTFDIDTGPDEEFGANGASLGRTTQVRGTAIVIVVRGNSLWQARGVDLKRRA